MVNLDQLPAEEIVAVLLAAEERVLPAVRAAAPRIAEAADMIAERWRSGGRLVFVGAGTGARLAWTQAAELPGTFALPPDRVCAVIAGGWNSTDVDEDDLALAEQDVARIRPSSTDAVVAVAASGSTPYTLSLARAAREAGAALIAVVAVSGSPLAAAADVAVETLVGPEPLRGSSRLGAGTAQKLALDALTTAAAARLGRVHGQHMIDVVPANAKLRERAAGIVADIAGCDIADARATLAECDNDARTAVLVLMGGLPPAEARRRVASAPTLRAALAELE